MKRALLIGIVALTLMCGGVAAIVATITGGQQAVRVLTLPIPGTRGLIIITTPCAANKSGSIGLWTTRQPITRLHVVPLRTWTERRDALGSGVVNRLVVRATTFQRC